MREALLLLFKETLFIHQIVKEPSEDCIAGMHRGE